MKKKKKAPGKKKTPRKAVSKKKRPVKKASAKKSVGKSKKALKKKPAMKKKKTVAPTKAKKKIVVKVKPRPTSLKPAPMPAVPSAPAAPASEPRPFQPTFKQGKIFSEPFEEVVVEPSLDWEETAEEEAEIEELPFDEDFGHSDRS